MRTRAIVAALAGMLLAWTPLSAFAQTLCIFQGTDGGGASAGGRPLPGRPPWHQYELVPGVHAGPIPSVVIISNGNHGGFHRRSKDCDGALIPLPTGSAPH